MNNKVSVIMPSYNSAEFINDSINSVKAQTYTDWELIIVDDNSTDDSWQIISGICRDSKKIRSFRLDKNQGPAACRNRATEEARGRYIAFLDSDDIWMPDKLEKQLSFMDQQDAEFSYTYYRKISEQGDDLDSVVKSPDFLDYNKMLKANFIGCLTVIYDSMKIGKQLFPDLKKRQDYALWLKIFKQGIAGICLKEQLAGYRVRTNSVSSSKIKNLKFNWLVYRKCEGFGIFKSAYYIIWNIFIKLFIKQ